MGNSKDTKKNDDRNITKGVHKDQKQKLVAKKHCTTTSFKFFLVNKAKHKRTK